MYVSSLEPFRAGSMRTEAIEEITWRRPRCQACHRRRHQSRERTSRFTRERPLQGGRSQIWPSSIPFALSTASSASYPLPARLAGTTFVAKDLYDVQGYPTGAGNPDWGRTHGIAGET